MKPGTLELRKFVAPEIIYGVDALRQAGRSAKRFGARRVLVVTDPGVVAAGWTGAAVDSLDEEGIPAAVFANLTPNPKDHEVAAGAEFYRANDCDVILAVGGGSPIDCAKGIGILCSNGGDILQYRGVDEVPVPMPPLICVPTTAGSSADVSQFAIITDTTRKVKVAIISKAVVPDIALVDPRTTTTLSAELTAQSGIDALVHAIESYVSNASSPLTDLHATAAIPLIAANLRRAVEEPGHLETRGHLMLGSMLAGLAFSNASLGLVHAMAHSLGGLCDLPHGACNAALLAPVVAFNYDHARNRYDHVARLIGLELAGLDPAARCDALATRLRRIGEEVGFSVADLKVHFSGAEIQQLARNAFHDPCLATNPRPATVAEIGEIYGRTFQCT